MSQLLLSLFFEVLGIHLAKVDVFGYVSVLVNGAERELRLPERSQLVDEDDVQLSADGVGKFCLLFRPASTVA